MRDARSKLVVLKVEHVDDGMVLTATIPTGLLENLKNDRVCLSMEYPIPPKPDPAITPTTSHGNYPRK